MQQYQQIPIQQYQQIPIQQYQQEIPIQSSFNFSQPQQYQQQPYQQQIYQPQPFSFPQQSYGNY
jgi:ABC-2 type transport system ATP-binding protein